MLTCKQVSKALASQDYETLPLYRKAALKLHVALCLVCHRYNKQVMLMQDACRKYREQEEELLEKSEGMSADQKAALNAVLKEQISKAGELPE